jgi:hypothetical protein
MNEQKATLSRREERVEKKNQSRKVVGMWKRLDTFHSLIHIMETKLEEYFNGK